MGRTAVRKIQVLTTAAATATIKKRRIGRLVKKPLIDGHFRLAWVYRCPNDIDGSNAVQCFDEPARGQVEPYVIRVADQRKNPRPVG